MELTEEETLRPIGWYKWMVCIFVASFWAVPGLLSFLQMNLSPAIFITTEILWLALLSWLSALGLSWFRVRVDCFGVARHGLCRTITIPWAGSTVHKAGQILIVFSLTESIRINTIIYKDPKKLEDVVARYHRDANHQSR